MLHRLLPFTLVILAFFLAFNIQSIRREFAYNSYTRQVAIQLGVGDPTTSCCDLEKIAKSTGNFDESANLAIFNSQVIDYPKTSLAYESSRNLAQIPDETKVLGIEAPVSPDKWIEVSIEEQKVRAWDGEKLAMEFPISSGKWSPTPKGDFRIWYKTRSQLMTGGSKDLGTYYYLPGVPYNMFFYSGYALHGAYWHNNFGQPMSHGCVNEPLANAAQIFQWAGPVLPPGQNAVRATDDNPGTRVYIH